jgi:hypothetical protein
LLASHCCCLLYLSFYTLRLDENSHSLSKVLIVKCLKYVLMLISLLYRKLYAVNYMHYS